MPIIRRKLDGEYIATLEEFPGYRHITYTKDPARALQVDEKTAARLVKMDFTGEPYGLRNPSPPKFEWVDPLYAGIKEKTP